MALRAARRRPARLPDWIEPQLTRLVTAVPAGDAWAHEIKYDGYRLHARIDGADVRLLTRTGLDWTFRYREIAETLAAQKLGTVYLDGELCALRPDGTTSFSALQAATDARSAAGLSYFVFDVLHHDGTDLRMVPLGERKQQLAALLTSGAPTIAYSGHIVGGGETVYREACELRVEGVVSKRLDAPYVSGDRGLWTKTKCVNREEFVVVGWTDPEGGRPHLGALLLAYWTPDGRLVYAGRAGSGMREAELAALVARLRPLARAETPLDVLPPRTSRFGSPLVLSRVHWVRPELVVEVAYLTWTDEGLLRQVVYHGVREDKPARAVVRAPPTGAPAARASGGASRGVPRKRPRGRPSGAVPPENVLQLLPDAVVPSRAELVRYWTRVAPRALRHLANRPLKLVRHVHNTTFFHMGALPPLPDSVHTLRIKKAGGGAGVRVWVDSLDGLLGLVEIGAVELHPWGAHVDDIERADRLVFDLDPGSGVPWSFVIETALAMRDVLAAEGFACWPKTSGGKGLHLMIDVAPTLRWAAAHALCRRLAQDFARRAPARYTTSARMADRPGRLFIDYLRNGRGTTAVGAYSPRARPGLPIAAPVSWRAVERGVRADAFTMTRLPPASADPLSP